MMPKTLTFVHTSPAHVATFNRLLAELDPPIPVRHVVDEGLLHEARAAGQITPPLARRVTAIVEQAFQAGAAVVVCTCSTIGGCAEAAGRSTDRPVLRIDRAMAEQAVALGDRIAIAATLATTLAPTRALILEVARRAGKTVDLAEVVCADAWARFEAGDQAGYLRQIADSLHQAPAGDVIVLAQASMAGALSLCGDIAVPILSSPRLGLEAALRAYYAAA